MKILISATTLAFLSFANSGHTEPQSKLYYTSEDQEATDATTITTRKLRSVIIESLTFHETTFLAAAKQLADTYSEINPIKEPLKVALTLQALQSLKTTRTISLTVNNLSALEAFRTLVALADLKLEISNDVVIISSSDE